MRTVQISVERNFHIMNEDRFIMEKISHTIELEEHDKWNEATALVRLRIQNEFQNAYPHLKTYLNFDEIIQANNNIGKFEMPKYNNITSVDLKDFKEEIIQPKKSIEEQIEACTEIELPNGLLSFEYLASMNKKLKVVYDKKLSELKTKNSNKHTTV